MLANVYAPQSGVGQHGGCCMTTAAIVHHDRARCAVCFVHVFLYARIQNTHVSR
jgi:hypothetical protein